MSTVDKGMAQPSRVQQLFDSLRALVKTKNYDYTRGSLKRAVALLAIPMGFEFAMEALFAVIDLFFVSLVGSAAIAVLGLTESVMLMVSSFVVGMSVAVTAVVARRVGEGNSEGANLAAGQVLIIGLLFSLLVSVVGWNFGKSILLLLGADDVVASTGESYIQVMMGGSISMVYLFLLAAIFRGGGDPIIALKALLFANAVNIALDPCLIFGFGPFPELGVTGAAIATVVGRTLGVLYLLYHLFNGSHRVGIALKHLKVSAQLCLLILKISLGAMIQIFLSMSSVVFLLPIFALFGTEYLAAGTIALRIGFFTKYLALGGGRAAATMVGQCLGAGDAQRAEKAVWLIAKYNFAFMLFLASLTFFFASQLMHVFTQSEVVISTGTDLLRILSVGYVFFGSGLVFSQAFNGAGHTFTPLRINLISFWLIQIPLAWFAVKVLGMSVLSVAMAVCVGDILLALIGGWIFTKDRWKRS